MNAITRNDTATETTSQTPVERKIRQQVVLVLQGGGALGAYQAGVYQALVEDGIEPDWVIGTSIGAINAALIAGNEPGNRMARLQEFWNLMSRGVPFDRLWPIAAFGNIFANFNTVTQGLPGFFKANTHAMWGPDAVVGLDRASYYSTQPLQETLERLVAFDCVNRQRTRLSVGAVNVRSGEMRYFDSRAMPLSAAHVMASGALPPAFPAIRIEGEPYWDGGLYSNTPIEMVLEDYPRRDSVIISVNLWQPSAAEPETIRQVLGRHKDIQFASRGKSHVARQAQIHKLRHVVRELSRRLPPELKADPVVQDLTEYGCGTRMHLLRLLAPALRGDDHTKDIDFTRSGIEQRWQAGLEHARKMLARRPWEKDVDPLQGIVIHEDVMTET